MAKPADKHPDIRAFQSAILGTDVTASIESDICVHCGGPAKDFEDAISAKEFTLSGTCQVCQDNFFGSGGR